MIGHPDLGAGLQPSSAQGSSPKNRASNWLTASQTGCYGPQVCMPSTWGVTPVEGMRFGTVRMTVPALRGETAFAEQFCSRRTPARSRWSESCGLI